MLRLLQDHPSLAPKILLVLGDVGGRTRVAVGWVGAEASVSVFPHIQRKTRRLSARTETLPSTCGIGDAFSASADRLAEDVLILAIIVTELKFGDVERQIFGADLVESADNAALEDRPEAF